MPPANASRVTLLALNAKYVHSSLAVWCLSEAVSRFSRFKHEINIIETSINQPDSDILSEITAATPEILGISVYIWNARKLESLLKAIRLCLPDTKLVLGGPEASYNAMHWLRQGADFVIQGEGERSFPSLLDTLSDNAPAALDTIPGLWRYADGDAVCTPADAPDDTVIDPYSDAYLNRLDGRIAYIETSRGCPFQCAFCLSGNGHPRFFPLDTAKKQLCRLSQAGTQTIKLVDRTFNCNVDRAYELFEYIIGLNTSCCFHFEVAADLFDERTLSLLRTSPPGRIQFEAGLQSFYEPALNAVSRKTSLLKAEQNLKALISMGNIHVHIDLIAGLPPENLADFKQSFDRAYAIGAHTLQLGFLKLLHGSVLRERAEQWELCFDASPPYEILGSPWLNAGELKTIKQVEHALRRVYNSGRFLETARYVLSTGISPFEFYHKLGMTASGYGVPLNIYAEQIYNCLITFGIDSYMLRDHMIRDWLCSMRGKNMPSFLRVPGGHTGTAATYAQQFLGRKIERCETAVLWTDKRDMVFIDSRAADPVTGRYALYGMRL